MDFKGLNVGVVDERGEIAALYKGVVQNDIGLKTESYSSRINIYGGDGKTSQFRGPAIRIDSVAPTIDDMDISVTENHDSRILQVDVSSSCNGVLRELS